MASVTAPTRPRLVTAPFVIVTAATLAFFVFVGIAVSVMPRFIENELGGDGLAIGLNLAVFSIAAIAARPAIAFIGDRFGRRSLMIGGSLLVHGLVIVIGLILGSIERQVTVHEDVAVTMQEHEKPKPKPEEKKPEPPKPKEQAVVAAPVEAPPVEPPKEMPKAPPPLSAAHARHAINDPRRLPD